MWDETLDDLGALAEVPSVTEISLHLGAPWPAVGALGALPGLRNIFYTGNLLALQEVDAWPVLERAWFQSDWQWSTPLRDARGLPAMPLVKYLKVDGLAALRGIERFTAVHELDVRGPFADLGPLAGLSEVRQLAMARFPWEILLLVEPHGDLSEDLEEIEARHGADDGETFDVEREREEWNETQERLREHREFLEREHRLRLQQQDGRPIDPAAFSPPGTPPPPANEDGETVTAQEGDEEAQDFGKDFGFTAIVSEAFVWVHDSGVENAAGFFGVTFEDWHALPEPPEERPRPA